MAGEVRVGRRFNSSFSCAPRCVCSSKRVEPTVRGVCGVSTPLFRGATCAQMSSCRSPRVVARAAHAHPDPDAPPLHTLAPLPAIKANPQFSDLQKAIDAAGLAGTLGPDFK